MPFVWKQELTIVIYEMDNSKILQKSTYGTGSRNYRIDTLGQLYITNFQTLKSPTTYVAEIYRGSMHLHV
jgi:hypothetical protein